MQRYVGLSKVITNLRQWTYGLDYNTSSHSLASNRKREDSEVCHRPSTNNQDVLLKVKVNL